MRTASETPQQKFDANKAVTKKCCNASVKVADANINVNMSNASNPIDDKVAASSGK